jgi:hypothetical protein
VEGAHEEVQKHTSRRRRLGATSPRCDWTPFSAAAVALGGLREHNNNEAVWGGVEEAVGRKCRGSCGEEV